MRLLTHNFLQSNVKGTTQGYPLKIEPTNIVIEKSTMDAILVNKVLYKVNYSGLKGAIEDIQNAQDVSPEITSELSEATGIPSEPPKEGESVGEDTLKALHFFLFDVHILDGTLVCPDTGRKFPIKDGIPNMILHEDEV